MNRRRVTLFGSLVSLALWACGGSGGGNGGSAPPTNPSPSTGSVVAKTETAGEDLDGNGYTVTLSPDESRSIGTNDSIEFADVAPGDHQLELRDIASNCRVEGDNPRTLSVQAGNTSREQFSLTCLARLGQDVIAFASDSTGDSFDIAVINGDGTGFRAIAPASGRDVNPEWSPSGQKIVFESDRTGVNHRDLFVANLDGSNPIRLTTNPGFDTWPDWSPDGSRIVFSTEMGDNRDIATVRPDGSDLTNITQDSADNRHPRWSPDSEEIVFERYPLDGPQGLYSIKPDGTGLRKLADGGTYPRWSPDGRWVAVGGGDLVLVNRDDTTKNVLVNDGTNNQPVWSPDGEWIAFVRRGDDAQANDIFLIRPDGTGLRNLTDDPSNETQPSWSEDGSLIAFTRERRDNRDIFLVDLDGNTTRLTSREGADAGPVWSRGRD